MATFLGWQDSFAVYRKPPANSKVQDSSANSLARSVHKVALEDTYFAAHTPSDEDANEDAHSLPVHAKAHPLSVPQAHGNAHLHSDLVSLGAQLQVIPFPPSHPQN